MAAVPVDFIEKFGFHLGLGVGVGFLAAGTKALREHSEQVSQPRCPDCLLRTGHDSGGGIGDAVESVPLAASALDDFSATGWSVLPWSGVVPPAVEDDDGAESGR